MIEIMRNIRCIISRLGEACMYSPRESLNILIFFLIVQLRIEAGRDFYVAIDGESICIGISGLKFINVWYCMCVDTDIMNILNYTSDLM